MNIFQKAGKKISDLFLRGMLHFAYPFWAGAVRLLYRPKIIYTCEEAEVALRAPCVLIANHNSHKDGYYLPMALRRCKMYVYVTTKWFDKKGLGWIFRRFRYIPIDLTTLDTAWLERGRAVAKKGYSLLIFPEGKRSQDGTLGDFQPGFLMLARQLQLPVVPVVLPDPYEKGKPSRVIIGAPLRVDEPLSGRLSALLRKKAVDCHECMDSLLEEAKTTRLPK